MDYQNKSKTALKHTNAVYHNYSSRGDIQPQYASLTLNQRVFHHCPTQP